MHVVLREIVQQPASVFLNTSETHMLHADQSVWSTQTVRLTKHVRETSVLILVLEPVVAMPCVEFLITYQPARVKRDTSETPSHTVD